MSAKIKSCSEAFQDAVCESGTAVATCELCGVTYFQTGDPGCFDEGELALIKKKRQANPKLFRETDATSVSYGTIAGKQVVWGCQCGWKAIRHIEDNIWENRELIRRYFTNRTKTAFAAAASDHAHYGDLPT